jgi:hypothetical protein
VQPANGVDRSFAIGVPTFKGHAMSYGTIGVTPVTPRIDDIKEAETIRVNFPLNSEGGRTIGVRAHLFLFLDDLIPAVFGKPLLESVTHVRPEARERR